MTSESIDDKPRDLTALPLFAQPVPASGPRASSMPRPVTSLHPASDSPVNDVDWSLVAALRAQASEQLSQAVAADRARLDKAAQEELGRSIVLDLIDATVSDRVNAGDRAWSLAEQNALEAVRLNPEMARAQGRLGEAFFRQNNYQEAIEALETAVSLYGRATELNARFFNMLASAYIRHDLNNCALAAPLFEQVLDATTNELIVAAANEGLVECRRASFGTAP